MRGYFKSPFTIFLVVVIVILFAIMIYSVASGHSLTPGENAVGTVMSPLQTGASAIRNWVGGIFSRKNAAELQEENEILKKQLEEALLEAEGIDALRAENEELRGFLELKENYPSYELVYANVIAFDAGNIYSNITINRGKAAGIKKNDVVVSPDGLVGIVFEVGVNYAKVSTVLNTSSSVGATVVRTRESGILTGDYSLRSKGQCKLTLLRDISAVAVGDTIKTSGLGDLYPEGLVIGTVVAVEENSDFTANAVVQTSAKLKTLNGVMVLTNYSSGGVEITVP